MIFLDTNVVSELDKLTPDPHVIAWFTAQSDGALFIPVIAEAELRLGVELLPPGKGRDTLARNLARVLDEEFAARIVPFDTPAAIAYATIVAGRQKRGRPIVQSDAQIAAIARSRNASLATRNTADFVHCDITIINPWTFNA